MNKIKKFKLKAFRKKGSKLIPISFNKKFFFEPKRIFYIYGKRSLRRGDHAHKKCSQIFIPMIGKDRLTLRSINKTKKIILNHKKNDGLYVPPKVWCNVEFLTNNSVLMVICDKDYDFKDYLETFEDFIKYTK